MSRIQPVANTEPQEAQNFIGLRGNGFEDYEDARTGENRGRDLGSRSFIAWELSNSSQTEEENIFP